MLRNYLLVALRSAHRQRVYALINVAGLTLGIASALLVVLYVAYDLSFDRFHDHVGDTYRVIRTLTVGDETRLAHLSPAQMAGVVADALPEVEATTRLYQPLFGPVLVRRGDVQFHEQDVAFVDPSFFDIFSFTIARGAGAGVLARPFNAFLTRTMARKYFGDAEALGSTLTLVDGDETHDFTIAGILDDPPANTHLHLGIIAGLASISETGWGTAQGLGLDDWRSTNFTTYLRLLPGTDPRAFDGAMDSLLASRNAEAAGEGEPADFDLQPLTSIHLRQGDWLWVLPEADLDHLYVFGAFAVFLLLIAASNFSNLATAQFTRRIREVGVRKALGARRGQLARQFLVESLLTSVVATGLSVPLVELALPLFRRVAGAPVSFGVLSTTWVVGALTALAVLVGLSAGVYPALFLSRARPALVLKGRALAGGGGRLLRKSLIVLQFTLSSVLLVGTAVVYAQLDYISTRPLGFDADHVVVLDTRDVGPDVPALKQRLLQLPGVRQATASYEVPGSVQSRTTIAPAEHPEQSQLMHLLAVDLDFVRAMNLDVLAGRAFSERYPTDQTDAVMLSQSAAAALGWPDAVGRRIQTGWGHRAGTVVGVFRDFHYQSLRETIAPLVLIAARPRNLHHLSLRIDAADVVGTMAAVQQTWKQLRPDAPFQYTFLDGQLDALYRQERQFGEVFGTFALLTILVACLGLFGLTALTTEQQSKEIGIRRVFGASVLRVVVGLSVGFARPVLLALALATPIAYVAMRQWLGAFAYHVPLQPHVFALCAALVLAVAMLAVGYRAFRAAVARPANALRAE